ncbi:MAG: hypothetical protein IRZ00_12235, partial [Gemmatimonadetes bacterium]|nr:hypothetical protein [Gemmatimonadota bacterium]
MTSAEFHARYQLLRQVTEDGVRTHHAMASTGAVVMVHFLGTLAPEEQRAILAAIERLSAQDRRAVLDVTDVDGAPVVVTKFVIDFESLPAWLASKSAAAPVPPALPATPASTPPHAPAADPAPAPRAFGVEPLFAPPPPPPPP